MTERKKIHLVCNAHLDPVWLWEWEEGAGEALSTFRIAADFCESHDGFVFCHNEVILYEWVEEYEPALFRRIQKLVKEKKWHIMGGWFLQPDCNMSSGESLVRQMLVGRNYFKDKFGAKPTTAINFDPFGHSRGLVQLLTKAGFDSYVITRPLQRELPLSHHCFRWVGYDGSDVLVTRALDGYLTLRGHAAQKTEKLIEVTKGQKIPELVLWGIGNHGGGPSRTDLKELNALIKKTRDHAILHSTPEAYFSDMRRSYDERPLVEASLNPCMVGCYSSQVRIKQEHRRLENDLFLTEKMCVAAMVQSAMRYPKDELDRAQRDLLIAEFHDILPGSAIQPVEEASLRLMAHGRETLSRMRARAFFALANKQKKIPEGQIPVFVYNPHPYPVQAMVSCEFQLADQNWSETFTDFEVFQGKKRLPAQVEKEASNLTLDWRKRIVFLATLKPFQMNRFLCRPVERSAKPVPSLRANKGGIRVKTDDLDVEINSRTGLMDRYRVKGKDLLKQRAFLPVVLDDSCDPWESGKMRLGNRCGVFRLMSRKEGAAFSGLAKANLPSVRVVEDGAARVVIEALFSYNHSQLLLRYAIPRTGTEIEIEVRVYWGEKDKALKLQIPSAFGADACRGETVYGAEDLDTTGNENVSQKWLSLTNALKDLCVSVINDGIYASDCRNGTLQLTLLRSPAYSALPIGNRTLVREDRFTERIDQGERVFRFWINGGMMQERLEVLPREAQMHNEQPVALSFFPAGSKAGKATETLLQLSDSAIVVGALKKAERGGDVIVRLFEPTGKARVTDLSVPSLGIRTKVAFSAFELKTLSLNLRRKTIRETPLLE